MTKIIKQEVGGTSIWFAPLLRGNEQNQEKKVCVIRPLSFCDVHKMGKLSQEIYAHLQEDEKCFIHQHNGRYFSSVFNQKDITYIGVFYDSKLIGMSYLRVCKDKERFLEEIPMTSVPEVTSHKPIATFGGDCVHPDYRGNGLNRLMINFRLHLAKKQGCYKTYSIIDRNNRWNMRPYFDNDFCMIDSGIDPSDNGKIAFMCRRTGKQVDVKNSMKSVSFYHHEQVDYLLQNGYVAHRFNIETQHLVFSRRMPFQIRIRRNLNSFKIRTQRQAERIYL